MASATAVVINTYPPRGSLPDETESAGAQQAEVKPAQRAPLESGFLANYRGLQPGQKNQVLPACIDPNVNWADHTKVWILPLVTFWGDNKTKHLI